MIKRNLSSQDARTLGATVKVIVDYTDINTQAGLTKTLDLLTALAARNYVQGVFFNNVTPFVSATATSLTLQVGWDSATGNPADDPDGLIEAAQIQSGVAGLVLAGDGTGVAFATKRTGFAIQETTKLTALFTSITGNLTTFTAGRVEIYFLLADLNKFAG